MELGSRVRLKAWGGTLDRRVVAVEGDHLYVCTDEEFALAKAEGREPIAVGFRLEARLAWANDDRISA